MKDKIQIIPTVMPDDYKDLVSKINFVYRHVSRVQIDVMDRKFVPSISWPYSTSHHFEDMMKQDEGLPHWQDLEFSVDLMVINPKEEIPKWIEVGVSEVIIHIESLRSFLNPNNPEALVEDVGWLRELKEGGLVNVCLALNPSTANESLDNYKGLYDSVQFMGIKRIGYQGEDFAEEVLEKISDFKDQYPEISIMVDGGVNEDTIKDLVKAGATRLAVGSAIFNAIDAKEAIKQLVVSSK